MTPPLPVPPLALLEGAALFLDFDGTLVELAEAPGAIRVPRELPRLLERLALRLGGRVAVVTGRSIADLQARAGPLLVALAGSHGHELRLPGGVGAASETPPGMMRLREETAAFAARDSRLLVEEKPAGIAVHYRAAPELEAPVAAFLRDAGERFDLRLQHGKMVAELLPHGADKGAALRRLMAEPPFAGARPVFVGDDLTDEHGFAAATKLGGAGILVGEPRETEARWRLPSVSAVLAWLEEAARG